MSPSPPLSPEARALAADPANLAFARKLAARMAKKARSRADHDMTESAAILGLVQAAGRFDPARGVGFRTFAAPRIVGAIRDDVIRARPGTRRGPRPTLVSIDAAAALRWSDDSCRRDVDALAVPDPAEPAAVALESADWVEATLRGLPPRHAAVMRALYLDASCRTQDRAGKAFGLTDSRVCQIRAESLAMIRERERQGEGGRP